MSPPSGQRWRLLSYRHMAATTLRLLSRWSSSLAVAHLRCRLALWLPSTSSSSIPFPLVTPWRTSSSTSSRVTTPPPTPPSTLMLGKSRDEERYAPSMAWLDPHRNAVFRHPLWVSANCPQSLRGKRIRCRDRRQGRFVLSRSQVSIAEFGDFDWAACLVPCRPLGRSRSVRVSGGSPLAAEWSGFAAAQAPASLITVVIGRP
jgi:hypothetical protein